MTAAFFNRSCRLDLHPFDDALELRYQVVAAVPNRKARRNFVEQHLRGSELYTRRADLPAVRRLFLAHCIRAPKTPRPIRQAPVDR